MDTTSSLPQLVRDRCDAVATATSTEVRNAIALIQRHTSQVHDDSMRTQNDAVRRLALQIAEQQVAQTRDIMASSDQTITRAVEQMKQHSVAQTTLATSSQNTAIATLTNQLQQRMTLEPQAIISNRHNLANDIQRQIKQGISECMTIMASQFSNQMATAMEQFARVHAAKFDIGSDAYRGMSRTATPYRPIRTATATKTSRRRRRLMSKHYSQIKTWFGEIWIQPRECSDEQNLTLQNTEVTINTRLYESRIIFMPAGWLTTLGMRRVPDLCMQYENGSLSTIKLTPMRACKFSLVLRSPSRD
jgi:hypothetical protein